jgi:hypothetical protein
VKSNMIVRADPDVASCSASLRPSAWPSDSPVSWAGSRTASRHARGIDDEFLETDASEERWRRLPLYLHSFGRC